MTHTLLPMCHEPMFMWINPQEEKIYHDRIPIHRCLLSYFLKFQIQLLFQSFSINFIKFISNMLHSHNLWKVDGWKLNGFLCQAFWKLQEKK